MKGAAKLTHDWRHDNASGNAAARVASLHAPAVRLRESVRHPQHFAATPRRTTGFHSRGANEGGPTTRAEDFWLPRLENRRSDLYRASA
jgi:hypothetical protein